MKLQRVSLKNVKFFAYHGFYPEEQILGSTFYLDIAVGFEPNLDTENLNKTVNYELLNAIAINQMKKTQKLLETLVKNILDDILNEFPFLASVEVSVRKQSPAMQGEVGYSEVNLSFKRDQFLDK